MNKLIDFLSAEQEDQILQRMIQDGTMFLDITYPEYPSPLTLIDLKFREIQGIPIKNVRYATEADIPKIRDFYEMLKLIESECAK